MFCNIKKINGTILILQQICIEQGAVLSLDSDPIFRPIDVDMGASPLDGAVLSVRWVLEGYWLFFYINKMLQIEGLA